ncbi:MAG: hypothetical protein HYT21_02000 [Candidatus Nealsonbacteria bacterium]|nr:hypothetical protein [Candidatus Nealsonbacteria bacterium]
MRFTYYPILISLTIVGTFLSMGASAQSIVDLPGDQLQLQTTSTPQYLFRCALSTDRSYQWQVRACAGDTCSSWATGQQFTTSHAPEVASPYDADWQSKEKMKNAAAVLDWCPAEGAVSYLLELYQKTGAAFNKVVLPERFIAPNTIYDDDRGWQEIKKATSYGWQVTACPGINTPKEGCGPFSQFWEFDTGVKLRLPTNLIPPDGSVVNLSTSLSWLGDRYAAGYLLHIQGTVINQEIPVVRSTDFPLNKIWKDWLALDAPYNWRVASCEGSATSTTGLVCEEETTGQVQWSAVNSLRTTGAPPTNVRFEPTNAQGQIAIPLTISWDDMPGAASYRIEVRGVKYAVLREPKLTLYFEPPFLQQGQSYIALIRTCADEDGLVCGLSTGASFTVAPLEPPAITAENLFIPSFGVKTNEVFGASAYQYQLRYESANPEETDACKASVGSVTETTIVGGDGPISVRCAGQYSLQGRGCIENTCAEPLGWGQWSGPLSLTIQEQRGATGLIPCGRGANNPSTPWDERESCGVKHIFLLIKIILDFLMFRLAPLALAALALYSGVIFYFALPMGVTTPVVKVKSLWRAAGIGLLIIFFAWLIINTFLGFVGFNIGVFGNWYEIGS